MILLTVSPGTEIRINPEHRRLELLINDKLESSSILSQPELRAFTLLIEQPGEAVSRDRLAHHAWLGRPVSQGSLGQAIYNLRKALGKELGHQVIKTAENGYQLDVQQISQTSAKTPSVSDEGNVGVTEHAIPQSSGSHNFFATLRKNKYLILMGILLLNAALAGWSTYANKDYSNGKYRDYRKQEGIRYLTYASLPNDEARFNSDIALLPSLLTKEQTLKPGDIVYINGAYWKSNHNYFICKQPLEKPDSQCISILYTTTQEGS
jgi:DNA-binding winged helix-turn-helix (wHTH) protein